MIAEPFDIDTFLDRARQRLEPEPPPVGSPLSNPRGDHDLNEHVGPPPAERGAKPAAVLIPVVRHPEATVLLTQRATALRDHAGQVAFPGGKIDREDASALAAALREAEEEIGLDRRFVTPIGYLDPYISGTGYRIMPVVALVEPGFNLTLNPVEVDAAFEVPLSFLMEPLNHQRHAREWHGQLRHYYAMPFGERYIWGATAGIIRNLYQRLYGT
ncbi:CoA pyrophosphatase [Chelatococcus reniformis]|uniref:Coenzyme A pyrophosphatase n=1 Tax=Chelatococcus reniformis TaxID=1494448 RepID=A0A916XLM6_9HYPH|nr:CoA pyrophosphatase [Chelatococcus reniformis]GGC80633.1 coenzyme A pyrophosphatase [Chelatococcus reniformis]